MSTREIVRPHAAKSSPSNAGPLLQRKCACGTHTGGGECDSFGKSRLRRKASNRSDPPEVPTIVHDVLNSPGRPLDSATRSFMEQRFGHDFSNVRVHTDAKAAESARAVNALAYTVGHNIAFGAGQYGSGAAAGRRLLAHELTHVMQQEQFEGAAIPQHKLEIAPPGAPAEQEADNVARNVVEGTSSRIIHPANTHHQNVHRGMIQCTPAPPTFDGVTGVRDLKRLSIDPVPDIETDKFLLPKDVRPHVTDPAVVHIEWILYDPNDKMVWGFTTLPDNPDSKTMPFTLKPSHFSGAGVLKGVMGKYILRSSGLNAKHQPIVYADRDITVVKTDLKTGTDVETTYGKLTFTEYSKQDATPASKRIWQVTTIIKFMPDKEVACDDVTYIQTIQSLNANGKSLMATTNNTEIDARQTPLAWSIDQDVSIPSPYYIADRNKAGKVVDDEELGKVGRGGEKPKEATLGDAPYWNRAANNKFETCVMCRSGDNKGQVYGCATWGFTADAKGEVTLHPRSFRQTPSDQFKEARDAWNEWRAKTPAATRPDEVPALKKP